MFIFPFLFFFHLIVRFCYNNNCTQLTNSVTDCDFLDPAEEITLSCVTGYENITLVNNRFNISVITPNHIVYINVSGCNFTNLVIENNIFFAISPCSNGTNRCSPTAILVEGVSNETVNFLSIENNEYGDDQVGFRDNRTKNNPTHKYGIHIVVETFEDFPLVLARSDPIFFTGEYLSTLRGEARYLFDRNKWMRGFDYDILITNFSKVDNCNYACKDICDACLLDPTRYSESVTAKCYNRTLFSKWANVGYNCEYDEVYVFPMEYEKESITFTKTITIRPFSWESGEITPGYIVPGTQVLNRPIIVHDHDVPPNLNEPIGELLENPHSIHLNGPNITFFDMDFFINGEYEDPFYGAVLFASTVATLEVVMVNCHIEATSATAVLFDPVLMNDLVYAIRLHENNITNIAVDIVPDSFGYLELIGNTFYNHIGGIVDTSLANGFIIRNNTGFNINFNVACGALFCLRDSDCTRPCELSHNYFDSIVIEEQFITYLGTFYSIYKLEEIGIELEWIFKNGDIDAPYGLEYVNLPFIPCNYTFMYWLKTQNQDLLGWEADIICDRGLPTEKICSGTCLPPRPPPEVCHVDESFLKSHLDYGYSLFNLLSEAVAGCLATPVQYIVINDGKYNETEGITFSRPDESQTELRIIGGGGDVIIIGHGHTFTDGDYDLINITGIEFHTKDFDESIPVLECMAVTNLFFGTVNNAIFRNLVFRGVNDRLGMPCATYLAFITFTGLTFEFVNIEMIGSIGWGLLLTGSGPLTNDSFVRLHNVQGSAIWKTFVDLQGIGKNRITNVKCVDLCGGIVKTEAIFRLVHKTSLVAKELSTTIYNLHVELNNSTFQSETLVPGGVGYISGIWIQNPVSGDLSFVEKFELKNITSNGYVVGLRYLNIAEEIIHLSEPSGSIPILLDSKRGMREMQRYNLIEGTIFDLKNGLPSLDDVLGISNACNDLCIPPGAYICEVSKTFTSVDFEYGTKRFNTIQGAINFCIIPTIPMPIKVLANGGTPASRELFVEDIKFNASKGITLYGEMDIFGVQRVAICGVHTFSLSQIGLITIQDFELRIGDCLSNRFTSIFSSATGNIEYNIKMQNLIVTNDFDINNDNITGLFNQLMYLKMSTMTQVELVNINVKRGVNVVENPIIEIESPRTVIVDGLTVEYSSGPALEIKEADDIILKNSVFNQCNMGRNSTLYYCVFVSFFDEIVANQNTFTRTGLGFVDGIKEKNGKFFTAFWIELLSGLTVNETDDHGFLNNITTSHIRDDVAVGVRIDGIVFSPFFLSLLQLIQKEFPRKISLNNLDILSLFHDIVINDDDQNIKLNASNNERLFCSDGCPIGRAGFAVVWYLLIFGGAILLVVIFVLVCPGGPYLLFGTREGFVINRDVSRGERRRLNASNLLNKNK